MRMLELNPIDTIPKDGTRVVIFFMNGNAHRVYFHAEWAGGIWRYGNGLYCDHNVDNASGWIPSPDFEEYC